MKGVGYGRKHMPKEEPVKWRVQKNLENFACVGAECEDTCCKGWEIGIDRESYRLYRGTKGEFGRRLFWGIDHRKRRFRLKGQVCAFLNKEGFCDIYKELGRAGMCRECREYPRHREDYGKVQEWMLSLSCPEAARIILGDKGQGAWQEQIKNKSGQGFPGISVDEKLLGDLEELRKTMVCLLKDRSLDWGERLALLLALAYDFDKYQGSDAAGCSCSKQRLRRFPGQETEQMIRMAAWMRLMGRMEPVLPDWGRKLERMCRSLYHRQSMEEQGKLRRKFALEAKALEPEWENLALYFVNTYLLGAVYDRDVYGKVKFVVFSVLMIREWCLFRYKATGRVSREEMAQAAYRYAREVENSDRNLELLEHEFAKNLLFGFSEMLRALPD